MVVWKRYFLYRIWLFWAICNNIEFKGCRSLQKTQTLGWTGPNHGPGSLRFCMAAVQEGSLGV